MTVLSRCLQFQLKNITSQTIVDYIADVLSTEGVNFEHDALQVIARSAQGSMRDALSLTDQAIAFGRGELKQGDVVSMLGVVGRDEITALMGALEAGSADQLLSLSAELAERNADFADVLSGMMEALHDAAVTQATGGESGPFLADEVQLYYQIALVGLRDLPIAPDPRSGFEMTMLRMLAFTPERDAGALCHRAPQSQDLGKAKWRLSRGNVLWRQSGPHYRMCLQSHTNKRPWLSKRLRRKNKRLRLKNKRQRLTLMRRRSQPSAGTRLFPS